MNEIQKAFHTIGLISVVFFRFGEKIKPPIGFTHANANEFCDLEIEMIWKCAFNEHIVEAA